MWYICQQPRCDDGDDGDDGNAHPEDENNGPALGSLQLLSPVRPSRAVKEALGCGFKVRGHGGGARCWEADAEPSVVLAKQAKRGAGLHASASMVERGAGLHASASMVERGAGLHASASMVQRGAGLHASVSMVENALCARENELMAQPWGILPLCL